MALLRVRPLRAADLLQRNATVKGERDCVSDASALPEVELGESFLDPTFELRAPLAVAALVVDRASLDRGDRT
jgi:hypothetical protein